MKNQGLKRLGVVAAAVLVLAPPAGLAQAVQSDPIRGRVYLDVAPMNTTVERRLRPQLDRLLTQLLREERAMTLDGVKVFDSGDKFLPGKIAIGLSYPLLAAHRNSPEFRAWLAGFRRMADLTVDDPNETWGIYYSLSALESLHRAGLLEQAVSPATLAKLKTKLDWRTFVRPDDLTLINLPNNYYGVAFSVARLRSLLGWEDASASEALLAKTLDHYRQYSGEYGFADETDGQGRFDRYSVLLIGEIAQRFIETGLEPPPEVRAWLRKSVDLMLPRFNLRGEGFEYGRSIGAYGDTAFLEVLTAAAKLKVLTPAETDLAYAFSSRISARYMDFWVDPRTGSVNLWDGGRRTDAYRGKHRIFGENLSLARQHFYTNALWNSLGYTDKPPVRDYARRLDALPRVTVTTFARGEYDRMLVTRRQPGGRVIGLPVINGGPGQHMNTPYYPVPFSPGMLEGSPDASYPHLLPRITLADGAQLAPLAFFKNARASTRGRRTTASWRQDELDRLGGPAPVKDTRLKVATEYVMEPGRITRTDRYTPTSALPLQAIELEFGTFSDGATTRGTTVAFARGDVRSFSVRGLDACRAEPVARDPYRTPVGPLKTRVACSAGPRLASQPFTVSWTLTYR